MRYNLAIIGGGPGGYSAAFEAVQQKLNVILFEQNALGGTCLNKGCVPTKFLSHVADTVSGLKKVQNYGISVENFSINAAIMQKKNKEIVFKLRDGLRQSLEQKKITIVDAHVTLIDNHTLLAEDESYYADSIIIATGSEAAPPFIDEAITTDALLNLEYIPKKLRIIGGGVTAVEFADIYNKLGAEVTMCLRSGRLLRKFDKEISASITQSFKKRGIRIIMNCPEEQMKGEGLILSAIGRKPNINGIAEELGLCIEDGIVTNSMGQTNIPGIYAVGDVVAGNTQLAHVAMEQGKNAVRAICGQPFSEDYAIVNCIYMNPEVASVGLSEAEAREKEIRVISGKQIMSANARTMISAGERGFVKILAEVETGRIVGAQLLCERASDIVSELALAINQKLTVEDLLYSVRPHPSYCEVVTEALTVLKGKMI